MVQRRTKEIGIRKVLGASQAGIIWKLIKEFLILVAIANIVALLLIYFGWNKVMETGLLYITDISIGTYIFAIAISLLATLFAVTSQTYKAVNSNPVDSLRYE